MSHVGTVRRGISEWPAFWSRYAPDRPALVFEGETTSWAALEDRAARIAGGLRAAGIRKGDRVGMLLRNAPVFFETLIACARIGAIFVPFNARLTGAELTQMADHAGLSLLISEELFTDRIDAVAAQVGADAAYFTDGPPDGGRSFAELRAGTPVTVPDGVELDDPLILLYTSGTTGLPKAAVLTHANAAGTSIAVINADGLRPSDRGVLPAPLAFAGSVLSLGLPFLHCGGSLAIEREVDPERLLDLVEHGGVTLLKLVPVIYQMLAASPTFEARDLSGLRSATSGGAPVPLDLLETFQRRGLQLGGAYGLTEGCGFNLHLPGHEATARIGWTGLPLPFQRCRVVDDAGEPVASGDVGELTISGPCVMQGYWRDPETTAETVRDGWLHTGDLAIADDAGYIKIVDRKKDMIISGGINVFPAEIERVLRRHPDVVDVAVVGVPDERWGETPMACVVSRDPALTLESLTATAAVELADYKRPRRMRIVDELPRNTNGKVLKRDIVRTVAADDAAAGVGR